MTATFSKEDRHVSLFILNRDLANSHEIDVLWEDAAPGRLTTSMVLTGSDLKAFNSFQNPNRVAPQEMPKPTAMNGRTRFEVPARSYTVLQWAM